jgi:predicted GH43/DUF377 family glycosyl hydrolase
MTMKLRRLSDRPVLRPDPRHPWEQAAVFNAAMVFHDGQYHMIYRATDRGGHERFGRYINTLGYATSTDLIHWRRRPEPILRNDVPQETRGPEDPRVVRLNGEFYMTYTGFGGRFPDDYRICLATSRDLIHWERQGVVLDEPNKNSAIFPQKFNGRYCLLHRRHPAIWIAYSDDLQTWTDHRPIMEPLPGTWCSRRIGIAGPPVRVAEGWFLIFHGVDEHNHYRLGAALLAADDPGRILARQAEPILEPELEWEINGFVPHVVFSCATVLNDDRIYCLYGGADTVLGMAFLPLEELVFAEKDRLG